MIPLAPLPLPPDKETQARDILRQKDGLLFRYLHNELVKRIESSRNKLESATGDEVVRLQQHIRANRELLAAFHNP